MVSCDEFVPGTGYTVSVSCVLCLRADARRRHIHFNPSSPSCSYLCIRWRSGGYDSQRSGCQRFCVCDTAPYGLTG